ncbi:MULTISPECIES: hypothetical protein [Vibrio harveyi group]|uniref:hypothetical protein n=1 Tax=Vibrio harveyi group TaxID=717610 RepID=UPI000471EDCB|nr:MULTISPECIES: hypothetical protein [Vibrio harveyi group]EGR3263705.1 hypothetical protein [Vibrio parahaemolyticus]EGX6073662.1 hypothetical protein [Vibrio parahaemolyticus]EKG9565030.1 hypothetical protein [Vibrio parahaemolyticus]EKG9665005.1 hypothetical protein [Vibrio parahaemolyticus]EKG9670169.1 hypothetical protein [Vibrio parahaemolyticus]
MSFKDDDCKLIANLLQKRGFVIDLDIPYASLTHTKFYSRVMDSLSTIQSFGYCGGNLSSWSTSFRKDVTEPAYGVYDPNKIKDPEVIFKYCHLLEQGIEAEEFNINQLEQFLLGVKFTCGNTKCNHSVLVDPKKIMLRAKGNHLQIRGRCTQCGLKNIAPTGLELIA